jgi:NAD(P)H-hydrate epimerase
VFAIGASPGLTGALCLCAQAALRTGAGLVTVGVPRSLNFIFEIKLTEVMSLPLKETKDKVISLEAINQISSFAKKIKVLALGCGAGENKSTQNLILKIITQIDKPMVVDADAINALAHKVTVLQRRKTNDMIITPHPGEFARLTGKSKDYIKKKRKDLVKKFALRYNLILVLKGHRTIVSDGRRLFENNTGNPGMATAGSGDVLTGIISALVAQGMASFEAAKLGVYLHGLSGDYAAKIKGKTCIIASDLIEYLPQAMKRCYV